MVFPGVIEIAAAMARRVVDPGKIRRWYTNRAAAAIQSVAYGQDTETRLDTPTTWPQVYAHRSIEVQGIARTAMITSATLAKMQFFERHGSQLFSMQHGVLPITHPDQFRALLTGAEFVHNQYFRSPEVLTVIAACVVRYVKAPIGPAYVAARRARRFTRRYRQTHALPWPARGPKQPAQ
jgi:hypothetical protein